MSLRSVKAKWIETRLDYDGSQLACQYAYLKHGVMGDSIIAFRGACDVKLEHMADGEDLLAGARICGSDMLHFLIELYDVPLVAGVAVQRLFASQVRDVLKGMAAKIDLRREGDDLFWEDRKLSISVAAKTPLSVVIHFAMNVANAGTPVQTCALDDFALEPREVAERCLSAFATEWQNLSEATVKVRPV